MKRLMMIATLLATMLFAGAPQLSAASLHSRDEHRRHATNA